MEADLKDRKQKHMKAAGDLLGKGTTFEVSMDLDTGMGHAELGGKGANVITGKLKAVVGLFRKEAKTTKVGQHGGTIADIEEGTFVLGDRQKDEDKTWSEWLSEKSASYLSPENLNGRWQGSQTLQKAMGNTLGALSDFTGNTGVEATWRVALAWDLNFDGSGSCDDDCAAGSFEEDTWSVSIEAQANLAAHTKIFGSEHKVQGGVSAAAEVDGNGKVTFSANAKAQHSQDSHMTTWKSSAKVYGGGGGPTGVSATNSVSEAMQDSAFARAPNGALSKVAGRPR